MVIFRVFANNSFENKTRKEEEVMDFVSDFVIIGNQLGLTALFQFDLVASLWRTGCGLSTQYMDW